MKNIYITVFLLVFFGCNLKPKSSGNLIKGVQNNYSKRDEVYSAKSFAWEKIVDSIYEIASVNKFSALKTLDNFINIDTTLNQNKLTELHFIKGKIYYSLDSLQNAINEFSFSPQTYPKILVARAGAYIKLKQFDKAYIDLKNAANINYDYSWNIGNYYEIIGKKDSSILLYTHLYLKDTINYKYCKDRIIEIEKRKSKPLKELIFRDRKRLIILTKGIKGR